MKKVILQLGIALMLIWMFHAISMASESIVYYHNPDGGQYIHSDSQCRAISSKYWPMLDVLSDDELQLPKYRGLSLCSYCCADINNDHYRWRGNLITGPFDLSEKVQEHSGYYGECYNDALKHMDESIQKDPEAPYREMVEGSRHYKHIWGFPREDEVSRIEAILLAYAALEECVGICHEELAEYYADAWFNIEFEDSHEWRVIINSVTTSEMGFGSSGYYVYIDGTDGMIMEIERY